MHAALKTAGAAGLMLGGGYGVAVESTSYQGSDYSDDTGNDRYLVTCDRESDKTIVKGFYDFNDSGGSNGHITDGDGNNGVCASRYSGGTTRRHKTCEARSPWPDTCGNWQATGAK
jgi:hypothetical protein